jgi:hypothetical protein
MARRAPAPRGTHSEVWLDWRGRARRARQFGSTSDAQRVWLEERGDSAPTRGRCSTAAASAAPTWDAQRGVARPPRARSTPRGTRRWMWLDGAASAAPTWDAPLDVARPAARSAHVGRGAGCGSTVAASSAPTWARRRGVAQRARLPRGVRCSTGAASAASAAPTWNARRGVARQAASSTPTWTRSGDAQRDLTRRARRARLPRGTRSEVWLDRRARAPTCDAQRGVARRRARGPHVRRAVGAGARGPHVERTAKSGATSAGELGPTCDAPRSLARRARGMRRDPGAARRLLGRSEVSPDPPPRGEL